MWQTEEWQEWVERDQKVAAAIHMWGGSGKGDPRKGNANKDERNGWIQEIVLYFFRKSDLSKKATLTAWLFSLNSSTAPMAPKLKHRVLSMAFAQLSALHMHHELHYPDMFSVSHKH